MAVLYLQLRLARSACDEAGSRVNHTVPPPTPPLEPAGNLTSAAAIKPQSRLEALKSAISNNIPISKLVRIGKHGAIHLHGKEIQDHVDKVVLDVTEIKETHQSVTVIVEACPSSDAVPAPIVVIPELGTDSTSTVHIVSTGSTAQIKAQEYGVDRPVDDAPLAAGGSNGFVVKAFFATNVVPAVETADDVIEIMTDGAAAEVLGLAPEHHSHSQFTTDAAYASAATFAGAWSDVARGNGLSGATSACFLSGASPCSFPDDSLVHSVAISSTNEDLLISPPLSAADYSDDDTISTPLQVGVPVFTYLGLVDDNDYDCDDQPAIGQASVLTADSASVYTQDSFSSGSWVDGPLNTNSCAYATPTESSPEIYNDENVPPVNGVSSSSSSSAFASISSQPPLGEPALVAATPSSSVDAASAILGPEHEHGLESESKATPRPVHLQPAQIADMGVMRALANWFANHVVTRLAYSSPAREGVLGSSAELWGPGATASNELRRASGERLFNGEYALPEVPPTPNMENSVRGPMLDPFNIRHSHIFVDGVVQASSHFADSVYSILTTPVEGPLPVESIVLAAYLVERMGLHLVDGSYGAGFRERLKPALSEAFGVERRIVAVSLHMANGIALGDLDTRIWIQHWADIVSVPRPELASLQTEVLKDFYYSISVPPKIWLAISHNFYNDVASAADRALLLPLAVNLISSARKVDEEAQERLSRFTEAQQRIDLHPVLNMVKYGSGSCYDYPGPLLQPVHQQPMAPIQESTWNEWTHLSAMNAIEHVLDDTTQIRLSQSCSHTTLSSMCTDELPTVPENYYSYEDDEDLPYDGAQHFPMPMFTLPPEKVYDTVPAHLYYDAPVSFYSAPVGVHTVMVPHPQAQLAHPHLHPQQQPAPFGSDGDDSSYCEFDGAPAFPAPLPESRRPSQGAADAEDDESEDSPRYMYESSHNVLRWASNVSPGAPEVDHLCRDVAHQNNSFLYAASPAKEYSSTGQFDGLGLDLFPSSTNATAFLPPPGARAPPSWANRPESRRASIRRRNTAASSSFYTPSDIIPEHHAMAYNAARIERAAQATPAPQADASEEFIPAAHPTTNPPPQPIWASAPNYGGAQPQQFWSCAPQVPLHHMPQVTYPHAPLFAYGPAPVYGNPYGYMTYGYGGTEPQPMLPAYYPIAAPDMICERAQGNNAKAQAQAQYPSLPSSVARNMGRTTSYGSLSSMGSGPGTPAPSQGILFTKAPDAQVQTFPPPTRAEHELLGSLLVAQLDADEEASGNRRRVHDAAAVAANRAALSSLLPALVGSAGANLVPAEQPGAATPPCARALPAAMDSSLIPLTA